MSQRRHLLLVVTIFAVCYFLPTGWDRFWPAVQESLLLARWYAREHVLLCLVPAFFIAGAIGVFLSQASVMKYLGAGARAVVAYPVAAVSGAILAVCSCTVLPLFAGIYKRGAGLGPATAFLYAGPAVNVMAIILTARILGLELGVARAVGAVLFSVIVGGAMHWLFRREEAERRKDGLAEIPVEAPARRLWQDILFFAVMIAFLVFANWGRPGDLESGFFVAVFRAKWILAGGAALALAVILVAWFRRDELSEWTGASWDFARQILPLLLGGVLVAGLLLGGPEGGDRGLIPGRWIAELVGGNSLVANFCAALAGALMYFATLTEVPILEGLLAAGMGKGPALALLLAGPAVSLPNLLVIRSVLGNVKTAAYLALVVMLSTVAGLVFGHLV